MSAEGVAGVGVCVGAGAGASAGTGSEVVGVTASIMFEITSCTVLTMFSMMVGVEVAISVVVAVMIGSVVVGVVVGVVTCSEVIAVDVEVIVSRVVVAVLVATINDSGVEVATSGAIVEKEMRRVAFTAPSVSVPWMITLSPSLISCMNSGV